MPDLYLDVLCSSCHGAHDLYNVDPAPHPRGCSYTYTCPATGLPVAVRVSFPDAVRSVVPAAAVPLVWVGDRPE